MPNIKSAKKDLRKSRAAAIRNRAQRSALRTAVKKARMAAAAKQAGKPDAANLLADMVEAIAAGHTIAEFKGKRA